MPAIAPPLGQVAKEGEPSRGGGSLNHVLRHTRLSDFETELQQFTVDAWSAPQRIADAYLPDQRADRVDLWPTTSRSGLPTSVTTKARAVPAHQGLRSDDPKRIQH